MLNGCHGDQRGSLPGLVRAKSNRVVKKRRGVGSGIKKGGGERTRNAQSYLQPDPAGSCGSRWPAAAL